MKNVVQDLTSAGLDWDREKWRGSVASKFIRGGEKNAVKYADEIIVLSKDVQKYFLETYGRETHFIPNGVNRPEVREAKLITDHFGLEKDSYILFLGRLVPEKGIRYLVEAFKNVKTDKKLVIAGGSSDTDSFMEELKELAKGDDRILFTGFVQGAMLDELYSNAYIYTLPSDLEGMPLSLLEAMSYGNCCLVSDIPECAEVVEDKAYHLVVVTKYRHPVLKGAIKVYLLDQTKTIFDSWHCTIKAVNTDLDHIHILFEAPPQVQLSKLANNYKTVTSRLIRKNFSEQLKQYYWKPYFWSDSYFVCSVSDRTESAVKSYIDSQ